MDRPPRHLRFAKLAAVAGFLVLLASSYYLRWEVLTLNRIRFAADETRSRYEIEAVNDSFPEQLALYDVAVKNYELQKQHYNEMLELYQTDYDAYVQRLKDEYQPPQLPSQPSRPRPPEYTQELTRINTEFRAQKYHYFSTTSALTWVAAVAAVSLAGGLLWLILFDPVSNRLIYLLVLVLSFVFLIGPSFHSILSAVVGFLEAPSVY